MGTNQRKYIKPFETGASIDFEVEAELSSIDMISVASPTFGPTSERNRHMTIVMRSRITTYVKQNKLYMRKLIALQSTLVSAKS